MERVRTTCSNCRRRHIKCDAQHPACLPCRKAKLDCERRRPAPFRHIIFTPDGKESADNNAQPESPTRGSRVYNAESFVDETDAIHRQYSEGEDQAGSNADETTATTHGDAEGDWNATIQPMPPDVTAGLVRLHGLSTNAAEAFENPPSLVGLPLAASIQSSLAGPGLNHFASIHGGDLVGLSALESQHVPATTEADERSAFSQQPANTAMVSSPIPQPRSVTPIGIMHPREAYLIKCFTQTWGPIFDCLDADRTFTRTVVQMAVSSSPPLFWAVLATSALQLSHTSDYPFAAAQQYRSRCSQSIMPMLLEAVENEAGEESLFATYVLLRNYEHMTGKDICCTTSCCSSQAIS